VPVTAWRKYLGVARRTVRSYGISGNRFYDEDDLIQEGMIALVVAATRFDETRGVPFAGYANNAIRYGIVNALRASDFLSQRDRATAKQMQKAEDLLYQAGVWEPTVGEIALACGISEERARAVRNAQLRGERTSQYSEEYSVEDRTSPTVEETVVETLSYEFLHEAFRKVPDRDRRILWLRYANGVPVKEIADEYELSEGRVSQIVKEARESILSALLPAGSEEK